MFTVIPESSLYTCGHCGKKGIPSIFQLVKDGKVIGLITNCSNELRITNKSSVEKLEIYE